MFWYDENVTLYVAIILGCYTIFHFLYKVVSDIILTLIFGTEYTTQPYSKKCRTRSGFVSIVHSTVTFILAVHGLLNLSLPWDKCLYDSLFARLLACMEIAYYLQDTYVLYSGETQEKGVAAYFLHHICVLIGIAMTIVCKAFAFFFCLRAINDFSVPCQNIRVILAELGRKKSAAYTINGILFLVTFFIGRVLMIPVTFSLILRIVHTADWIVRVPTVSKAIFLGFAVINDSLNLYWFYLLLQGAYKLFILKKD